MKTHCKNVVALGALAFFVSLPVRAQVGWVKVETNQSDAFVYADSTWLGTVETSLFQIPRGADKIILVPQVADVWSVSAISHSLRGSELDTMEVKLHFPYFYRLETIPSGVDIYLTDGTVRRHLGTAPLEYRSDTPLLGELIFGDRGEDTDVIIIE